VFHQRWSDDIELDWIGKYIRHRHMLLSSALMVLEYVRLLGVHRVNTNHIDQVS